MLSYFALCYEYFVIVVYLSPFKQHKPKEMTKPPKKKWLTETNFNSALNAKPQQMSH